MNEAAARTVLHVLSLLPFTPMSTTDVAPNPDPITTRRNSIPPGVSWLILVLSGRHGLLGAGWRWLAASPFTGVAILELMLHIYPTSQKFAHIILYSTDFLVTAIFYPGLFLLIFVFMVVLSDEHQKHNARTPRRGY